MLAIIDYLNAQKEGTKIIINNPILFDASCNGFQHLTLMIDEISLCKELNLIPQSWSDNPNDFYSFIALKVKNYFLKELNENKYNEVSLKNINRFNTDEDYIEKLKEILDYLKNNYLYCLWCGIKFDSKLDMDENCPGNDYEDHWYFYILFVNTDYK